MDKLNTTGEIKSESKQKININWFDAGLILGILTALGYYVSYFYKKGYLMYYDVDFFINQITTSDLINSISIIISITVIGFIVVSLYQLFNVAYLIFRLIPYQILFIFRTYFLPYFIIAIITLPFTFNYIKIVIYILIGLLIIFYIFPVFKQRTVKGYFNKLGQQIIHDIDKNKFHFRISKLLRVNRGFFGDFLKFLKTTINGKLHLIAMALLLLSIVCKVYGFWNAMNQTDYLIIKQNQDRNFVVIDKIGDNLIIAPIDLRKKEIKKQYQVIEQKTNFKEPVVFEKMYLGGITVEPTKKEPYWTTIGKNIKLIWNEIF